MSSNAAAVSRSYPSCPSDRQASVVSRASDWAGFVVFAALAAWTVRRMPAVGIFLLPTIAHELISAVAFLIRDRARATCRSLTAQLGAYGGTFLLFAFFHTIRSVSPGLLAPTSHPVAGLVGLLVWLYGSGMSVFAVWAMRYSLSIEPQARRMVQSGPYRHVRHPIYLGYILQYAGLLLLYPSNVFATVLVVWLGLTLIRMRYEERVLASAFPAYEEYRRSTGALLPVARLRRSRHDRAARAKPAIV